METNSGEKVTVEIGKGDLIELSDYVRSLKKGLTFRGTNADGGQEFNLTVPKYADFYERQRVATEIVDNMLNNYKNVPAEPEKPKPSYCEKIFDLILSKPIPGVESIEVNESQRKFVVKYQLSDNTVGQAGHAYTIEELNKEWDAYIFVLNGNGDGLLGFRTFVEFLLIPHSITYADDGIFAVKFDDKKE